MATSVTPRVRWAAVGTVLVVAAVAAVMSYGHLRAVAGKQGEDAAVLFPLSVDGLIVAASLVLLTRRRAGQPGGALAWCGLLVGVAATVAGNIASAEATTLARLVAAWPPVAFALSYELLLSLVRPDAPAGPVAAPDPVVAQEPAEPEPAEPGPGYVPPAALGAPAQHVEGANVVTEPVPVTEPVVAPVSATARNPRADEQVLTARARELIAAAGGHPPGRRALARELGCTEHKARTVLDLVAAAGATTTTGAGTAGGEQ